MSFLTNVQPQPTVRCFSISSMYLQCVYPLVKTNNKTSLPFKCGITGIFRHTQFCYVMVTDNAPPNGTKAIMFIIHSNFCYVMVTDNASPDGSKAIMFIIHSNFCYVIVTDNASPDGSKAIMSITHSNFCYVMVTDNASPDGSKAIMFIIHSNFILFKIESCFGETIVYK